MVVKTLITIVAGLTLVGCQKEVPVLAQVRSQSDILFVVPAEHREDFCLNSAELRLANDTQSAPPLWEARLTPVNGAPCDYQIHFPDAARNFKIVRSKTALSAGEYEVVIDGGVSTARSRFTIPQDAPL